MKIKKIRKNTLRIVTLILVVIISVVITVFTLNSSQSKKVKVSFPYIGEHYGDDSYACEGLTVSTSYASNDKYQESGVIVDSGTKDVDKLAIKIDGQKLQFITGASVDSGETDSPPLNIIQNDKDKLIAVDLGDSSTFSRYVDTFTLIKNNGLAVWQENFTRYVLTGNPGGFTEYFVCR